MKSSSICVDKSFEEITLELFPHEMKMEMWMDIIISEVGKERDQLDTIDIEIEVSGKNMIDLV